MKLANALIAVLAVPALSAQIVEVVKVQSKRLERSARLPGEILPFQKVSLHARVTGFVEKVDVDRGSVVKQGQVLAALSAPEMTAQLAEARAKVQSIESQRAEAEAKVLSAQLTYERLKAASATPGAVSGQELDLADKALAAARALQRSIESSAQAARAAADAIRKLEDYLTITAPFDGVITARYSHSGALAGPATGPLLEIEQLSRLRVVVAVPEPDVAGVATGSRVSFTVPAWPGQTFSGAVARFARSLDAKTRTMAVELDVPNPKGALAPGMYPEVQWPLRRTSASLLVPPTSVVTTTERSFVIRVRGGKAEYVNVSRGAPAGDLVEVLGALAEGDEIVRRGSDEIREGTALGLKPSVK